MTTSEITRPKKLTAAHNSYVFPLALVTSLFFLWGLAYGLLDVLNKHFQDTLHITKQRSTLLQAAYFGAYFIIAIPAGKFMGLMGYKKGIIAGLVMYAIGAFLFFPASTMLSFELFLLALFILAAGLTFLETAANPYVTILGQPDTAAFRLNLSQSFNGIGSFLGPIIGASLFFQNNEQSSESLEYVKFVYIAIGIVVLIITAFFLFTSLPEIDDKNYDLTQANEQGSLFSYAHFRSAIVAQFFYVAAQVGCAALFINYCTEAELGIDNRKAAYFLSTALLLFTAGRFLGTFLMKYIRANVLLSVYAAVSAILCLVVVFANGYVTIYSLIFIFFFSSIMFPTIFALGIRNLGRHTKAGASFIIMSVVGGAIVPIVMGAFESTANAYLVPLGCYAIVFWYGTFGYKTEVR